MDKTGCCFCKISACSSFSQQFTDHPVSSVSSETVVGGDLLFHWGDGAVNGVGGVRDVEVPVCPVGEEIRQVSLQGEVGTADALVGAVSPSVGEVCLLCVETVPYSLPLSECMCEGLLIRPGEGQCQGAECLSHLCPRVSREILRHRFELMEVAYLYRNITEYRRQTPSAVHARRGECPSLLFQNLSSVEVVHLPFT